jgi:hypothetical protein
VVVLASLELDGTSRLIGNTSAFFSEALVEAFKTQPAIEHSWPPPGDCQRSDNMSSAVMK